MLEDPGSSMLQVLVVMGLLVLSALFSGSETAFFSINTVRLRELQEDGSIKAKRIAKLLSKPDKLLTTVLVGNTAVNVLFTSMLATLAFSVGTKILPVQAIGPMTALLTALLLLFFGEVTPKSLAANNPIGFAGRASFFMQMIKQILTPIAWLMTGFVSLFWLIMGKEQDETQQVTEEIIKTAVSLGAEEGSVEADEKAMIYGILQSNDLVVEDIMVPKEDIVSVRENTPLQSVARIIKDKGLSRIPVTSMSRPGIITGVVFAKDLLPFMIKNDVSVPVQKVMRQAYYCRPFMLTSTLLSQMQKTGLHMAIVTNQQDEVVGLVTLEDLLEEIVGEIADEHDRQLATTVGVMSR